MKEADAGCARNATALWRVVVAARRRGCRRPFPATPRGGRRCVATSAAWKMEADCRAAGVVGKVARDGRSAADGISDTDRVDGN